jgi:hypothetical protein
MSGVTGGNLSGGPGTAVGRVTSRGELGNIASGDTAHKTVKRFDLHPVPRGTLAPVRHNWYKASMRKDECSCLAGR